MDQLLDLQRSASGEVGIMSDVSAFWACLDRDMRLRQRAAASATLKIYLPDHPSQPPVHQVPIFDNLVEVNEALLRADGTSAPAE